MHFAPSDQTNSDISQDAGIVIAKLAKGATLLLHVVRLGDCLRARGENDMNNDDRFVSLHRNPHFVVQSPVMIRWPCTTL